MQRQQRIFLRLLNSLRDIHEHEAMFSNNIILRIILFYLLHSTYLYHHIPGLEKPLKYPGSSDFSCLKFPPRSINITCEFKKVPCIKNILQKTPCEIKNNPVRSRNSLWDQKTSASRLPGYRIPNPAIFIHIISLWPY